MERVIESVVEYTNLLMVDNEKEIIKGKELLNKIKCNTPAVVLAFETIAEMKAFNLQLFNIDPRIDYEGICYYDNIINGAVFPIVSIAYGHIELNIHIEGLLVHEMTHAKQLLEMGVEEYKKNAHKHFTEEVYEDNILEVEAIDAQDTYILKMLKENRYD